MSRTILREIVETKRTEVAAAKSATPIDALRRAAADAPPPRDFIAAIAPGDGRIRVIAEIKQASPSAGLILAEFDPVRIAHIYADSGASALSVLTDRTYFRGDLSFIDRIRREVALPVLRKDFLIDEYQVFESRAAGADAILLIAAILSPEQIESMAGCASAMDMSVLMEVHDGNELAAVRPLLGKCSRMILGINNRDLSRQMVDLATTESLASMLPLGTPFISESGISKRADVLRMRAAGASTVLVGESLMRADDIGGQLRAILP